MSDPKSTPNLSKSKLTSAHRCMRKLWLSTYEQDKAYYSSQAKLAMKNGDEVGEFAKVLYGTENSVEVPLSKDRDAMVQRTAELLSQDKK